MKFPRWRQVVVLLLALIALPPGKGSTAGEELRNMEMPFEERERLLYLVKCNCTTVSTFTDFVRNNQQPWNDHMLGLGPRWIIFKRYDIGVNNLIAVATRHQQELPVVVYFELPDETGRPVLHSLHQFYYPVFRDVTVTLYIRDVAIVPGRHPPHFDPIAWSHPTIKIMLLVQNGEALRFLHVCQTGPIRIPDNVAISLRKEAAPKCQVPKLYAYLESQTTVVEPDRSCLLDSRSKMLSMYRDDGNGMMAPPSIRCAPDVTILETLQEVHNFTTRVLPDLQTIIGASQSIIGDIQTYISSYYMCGSTFLAGSSHEWLIYCPKNVEGRMSFSYWVAPFELWVWIALLVTYLLLVASFSKLKSVMSVIVEGLSVMCAFIRHVPSSSSKFYCFLFFAVLIISTGYESKITSQLIAPPDPYIFPDLKALLDARYKILFFRDRNLNVELWGKYQFEFKSRGILRRLTDSFATLDSPDPLNAPYKLFKYLLEGDPDYGRVTTVSTAETRKEDHTLMSLKLVPWYGDEGVCYHLPEALTLHPVGIRWIVRTANRFWLKRTLRTLLESGLSTFWKKHFIEGQIWRVGRKEDRLKREKKSLIRFSHVASFFVICGVLQLLALIIFVLELFAQKWKLEETVGKYRCKGGGGWISNNNRVVQIRPGLTSGRKDKKCPCFGLRQIKICLKAITSCNQ